VIVRPLALAQNRQGLGSGYSVTQRQAYGMARRPSSDSDD
jgi:hypothetical protein